MSGIGAVSGVMSLRMGIDIFWEQFTISGGNQDQTNRVRSFCDELGLDSIQSFVDLVATHGSSLVSKGGGEFCELSFADRLRFVQFMQESFPSQCFLW